jgi:hypothetical protein
MRTFRKATTGQMSPEKGDIRCKSGREGHNRNRQKPTNRSAIPRVGRNKLGTFGVARKEKREKAADGRGAEQSGADRGTK